MNRMIVSAFNCSSSGSAFFNSMSSGVGAGIFKDQILDEKGSNSKEGGKYSIFDVANWFLLKQTMTQKKLQKLCYYAQAWCYALKDFQLADTSFEAWVHGPVSPVLYERFKDFGFSAIKISCEDRPKFDQDDENLLESVWLTYGGHSGNALEALSHSELPWKEAREGYADGEKCSIAISPETMRNYYRSIYSGKSI